MQGRFPKQTQAGLLLRRSCPLMAQNAHPEMSAFCHTDAESRLACFYHLYRIAPVPAYVDECEANSPSNLASKVTPLARRCSVPADVSAESFAGVAPL